MNETLLTYALYLTLAVSMTIWVARMLHRNGRVFLAECFHGNRELADSVNHLLVAGFYLVNTGFATLGLRTSEEVAGARGVLEVLSSKMGIMLLVLGGMHLLNLCLFAFLRRHARHARQPAGAEVMPRVRRAANVLDTL